MIAFLRSEPVLILGGVQAGIGLATAFGLQLSGQEVGAIVAFSAALLSIATRQLVTPAKP